MKKILVALFIAVALLLSAVVWQLPTAQAIAPVGTAVAPGDYPGIPSAPSNWPFDNPGFFVTISTHDFMTRFFYVIVDDDDPLTGYALYIDLNENFPDICVWEVRVGTLFYQSYQVLESGYLEPGQGRDETYLTPELYCFDVPGYGASMSVFSPTDPQWHWPKWDYWNKFVFLSGVWK